MTDPAIILSKREVQVYKLRVRGKLTKQIAGMLFISENTVKKHLANIHEKLSVNDESQLVRMYYLNIIDKMIKSIYIIIFLFITSFTIITHDDNAFIRARRCRRGRKNEYELILDYYE